MKPDNVLTTAYLSKHPDNAARVLESLPHQMTAELVGHLSPEAYIGAYEYLVPSYGAKLLQILSDESRNKLIAVLSVEKLSVLLLYLDDSFRKKILSYLPFNKRKRIISRMQYPRETVGSIMKPPSFAVVHDISVTEALKRIRTSKASLFSEVIVLDKNLHYTGMLSLDKLIQAPPHKKVNSIKSRKVTALSARKSLQNLLDNPAWAINRVLPVTDVEGLLIGVLDYATLLGHKTLDVPRLEVKPATRSSLLEIFFQALAVPIEALAIKLFTADREYKVRNK